MIGEAEIQELMCEYAEALGNDGVEALPEPPSWPLTIAMTPEEAEPVSVTMAAMFRWPFLCAAEKSEGGAADEHRPVATRT